MVDQTTFWSGALTGAVLTVGGMWAADSPMVGRAYNLLTLPNAFDACGKMWIACVTGSFCYCTVKKVGGKVALA